MTPERPDYKSNPLWIEAMALTRAAYAVAEDLAPRDPDGARLLRKAAVAVPARLAGALSGDEAFARSTDAQEARAALAEVAARAEQLAGGDASGRLGRQARGLAQSVGLAFGQAGSFVC